MRPAAHRRPDDEALGLDRPAPRRDLDAGGFGYTPCGLLLGHVVLGCLMLERRRVAAGR